MRSEYDDEGDWVPVEDLIAGLDLDPSDPLTRTDPTPPPAPAPSDGETSHPN